MSDLVGDANARAAGGAWLNQEPMPQHVCMQPHIPYASDLGTGSVWQCRCGKKWRLIREQYAVYTYEEVTE